LEFPPNVLDYDGKICDNLTTFEFKRNAALFMHLNIKAKKQENKKKKVSISRQWQTTDEKRSSEKVETIVVNYGRSDKF
jgi:hypothetical protein